MKKIYRKTVFLLSTVLALCLTGGAIYFGKNALEQPQEEQLSAVFASTPEGSLSPIVLDGKTNAPICGATICVPETGKTYRTDENGAVGTIQVPILRDERFDDMLPKDWGEITLLVYQEGYAPYGLFYLRIRKDESRAGPTIFLYDQESFSLGAPFTIIENPDDAWARAILRKYQPENA